MWYVIAFLAGIAVGGVLVGLYYRKIKAAVDDVAGQLEQIKGRLG